MVEELAGYGSGIHLVSLLIGLAMLVMSLITLKFPAKKINHVYGYRTKKSMRNQKNWEFAQKYATNEMFRGGLIIIAYALSGMVYKSSILVETIAGTTLMTIMVVLLFIRTEKALKNFEKDSPEN